MRKLLLGIILGILVIPAVHSQTSLEGKVQDENKEGLIGATVVLFKSGVQKMVPPRI